MTSDAEIACPDPNCASRLRIVRLGKRRFSHAETTAVPFAHRKLNDDDAKLRPAPATRSPASSAAGGSWRGGHGAIDQARRSTISLRLRDAGITTFDCADIYTGVEELIGGFRVAAAAERGLDALPRMKVHTKLVPDLEVLPRISRELYRRRSSTSRCSG